MGLDTTHNCWHGPYSRFKHFRNHLAQVAGYMVAEVKYDDGYIAETVMVDWGHLQRHLAGDWDETPEDALLVLIVHHDCEGVIRHAQTQALADRMEELLPDVSEDWKTRTQEFIDGLRDAHSKGEDVEFR